MKVTHSTFWNVATRFGYVAPRFGYVAPRFGYVKVGQHLQLRFGLVRDPFHRQCQSGARRWKKCVAVEDGVANSFSPVSQQLTPTKGRKEKGVDQLCQIIFDKIGPNAPQILLASAKFCYTIKTVHFVLNTIYMVYNAQEYLELLDRTLT